ncbi:hypothetical protein J0H58_01540 [bacterium]|nr:hypothetical protein [bacterium]
MGALIAVVPPHMKIILALTRYGGLRCPSEARPLKWDAVYFDRDPPGMLVHAPKTEHHAGKGTRLIPVFASLRPHLGAARRAAAPGAVYVVAGEWADRQRERMAAEGGAKNVNLSNQFEPVLKAAGLPGWPAPFVTFRASCRTDLRHTPGITPETVARWMGHSKDVGETHYHRIIGDEARIAAAGPARGDRGDGGDVFTQAGNIQRHVPLTAPGNCGTDSGTDLARNPARTGATYNGQNETPSPQM